MDPKIRLNAPGYIPRVLAGFTWAKYDVPPELDRFATTAPALLIEALSDACSPSISPSALIDTKVLSLNLQVFKLEEMKYIK